MREPRQGVRRAVGGVVACVFIFAALLYPLVAPESTEPARQTAPTAQAAPEESIPQGASELDEPGIVMVVSPSLDGDLLVTETVRLSASTDTLTFGPPLVRRAGSQFDEATATATGVRLRSPGQAVSFPEGPVDEQVQVAVPATQDAEISYRLSGATVRSTPSEAGRASGAVSPLLRDLDAELPVQVVVTGPTVLNLACPLLPVWEQACQNGTPLAAQTKAPLPFADAVVTVQLDLRRT
ncbi:MAG: hypothetical protein WA892_07325 [Ornithinimicrobium sp.]